MKWCCVSREFGFVSSIMQNRHPCKFVCSCLLVLLFGAAFCCPMQAAESQRPNILLLLSDDHSYPFVGCYGDENVETPTLDGLAAEGMKFHRYFVAAPQCVPSRAALMTGRSPVAARMTRFSSPLPRDEITFPEILREKGDISLGYAGGVFTWTVVAGKTPSTDKCLKNIDCERFAIAWTS
jgi:hypothetical protein